MKLRFKLEFESNDEDQSALSQLAEYLISDFNGGSLHDYIYIKLDSIIYDDVVLEDDIYNTPRDPGHKKCVLCGEITRT